MMVICKARSGRVPMHNADAFCMEPGGRVGEGVNNIAYELRFRFFTLAAPTPPSPTGGGISAITYFALATASRTCSAINLAAISPRERAHKSGSILTLCEALATLSALHSDSFSHLRTTLSSR